MVSPTSLAGALTAAAALLVLAPHVSALPAPSSIAPGLASQVTTTTVIEATPEVTAAESSDAAAVTAAPDIRARSPGDVRPVALQKTHIFDYYAAPAGYHGFGKNRWKDDWLSRKDPQKEMNKMRPNRFTSARKYTPFDEYDGGPLDRRGEPEPPQLSEKVAEPEPEPQQKQEEEPEKEPEQEPEEEPEEEKEISSRSILSKRGPPKAWVLNVPPFYVGYERWGPDYKDVYKYVTWDSPSEPGRFAKHRGRNWRRNAALSAAGEGENASESAPAPAA